MKYIIVKNIKGLAKTYNKRVGKDFLETLDRHIEHKITKACETWNGKKKTLDIGIAGYVGLK